MRRLRQIPSAVAEAKDHPPVEDFRHLLDSDLELAMKEGDAFFDGRGRVHETLKKIADRLDELNINYVVVGGLALFVYGFRRHTEDVDILVTSEGLAEIHTKLEGLGYIPPFTGSKHLLDTQSKVKIEFLISGQFPGDGKPKPVAFPDPQDVAVNINGIRYLNLKGLIELKLASGMTSPGRIKDLGDVQELIKTLNLPKEFAKQLNPYVQAKFDELWVPPEEPQ